MNSNTSFDLYFKPSLLGVIFSYFKGNKIYGSAPNLRKLIIDQKPIFSGVSKFKYYEFRNKAIDEWHIYGEKVSINSINNLNINLTEDEFKLFLQRRLVNFVKTVAIIYLYNYQSSKYNSGKKNIFYYRSNFFFNYEEYKSYMNNLEYITVKSTFISRFDNYFHELITYIYQNKDFFLKLLKHFFKLRLIQKKIPKEICFTLEHDGPAPNELDFESFWLTTKNKVGLESIVFYYPGSKKLSDTSNIEVLDNDMFFNSLKNSELIHLIFNLIRDFIRILFYRNSFFSHFRNKFSKLFVSYLKDTYDVKKFYTSNSGSFPETFMISVLKKYDIKTFLWMYSAMSDSLNTYRSNSKNFSDILHAYSLFDNIIVWGLRSKDEFIKRQITFEPFLKTVSKIKNSTPINTIPLISSRTVEKLFEINEVNTNSLIATIFESPVFTDFFKKYFETEPGGLTYEYAETFYKDIISVLYGVGFRVIFIKQKKRNSKLYEEILEDIYVWSSKKYPELNIVLSEFSIDPFMLSKKSNLVFGPPFSSAAIAADLLKGNAIIYDPMSFFGKNNDDLLVSGKENLKKFIKIKML